MTKPNLKFKEARQLDLSTREGRIILAKLRPVCSQQKDYQLATMLQSVVFVNGNHTETHDDVMFDTDSLLKNYREIGCFYGHGMVKRCGHFGALTGDNNAFDMPAHKKCNGVNLVPHLIDLSAKVSCDAISDSPLAEFVGALYVAVSDRQISEAVAMRHPNYKAAAELMVQADKLNRVELDVFLKAYSHYLHNCTFDFPNLALSNRQRKGLLELTKEVKRAEIGLHKRSSVLHPKMAGYDLIDYVSSLAKTAVESGEFNQEIADETQARTRWVNFLQPIMDEYNSKLNYAKRS